MSSCGSAVSMQWSKIPCLLNSNTPQHILCRCGQADRSAASLYCVSEPGTPQSRSCSARLTQRYSCFCTNAAAAARLCGVKSSKQYCIPIKRRGCCGFVLPADAAPAVEQFRREDVFRTQRSESGKFRIWTDIAAERQRCGGNRV